MQDSANTQFSNLCTQADILYDAGHFDESIAYAMKAITLLPNEPKPYAQVAYAMASQHNSESSEWARKAIAKDPKNPEWRYALGWTFTKLGKFREGEAPIREALSLSPNNFVIHSELAHCLMHIRKFKDAQAHLEKALALNPQHAYAHRLLSAGFAVNRDYDQAETHIRTALKLTPGDAFTHNVLAWELVLQGKWDEAQEAFHAALRIKPTMGHAMVGLGDKPPNKKGEGSEKARLGAEVLRTLMKFRYSRHRQSLVLSDLLSLLLLVFLTATLFPAWEAWILLILTLVSGGAFFLLVGSGQLARILARRSGFYFY